MMPKIKLGKSSDFADYLQIKNSLEDIYWMGFDKAPDSEKLKEIYLNRIHSPKLSENNDKVIYMIQYNNGKDEINVGYIQVTLCKCEIELGYSVLKKYQNLGIATEALRQIIELYVKENMTIFANIRDDNIASQKCVEKLNFIKTNYYEKINYPIVGEVFLRRYVYVNKLGKSFG